MIEILSECSDLQKTLKDEYLLLITEQEQKSNFEKKLETALANYHRNFIHLENSQKSKDEPKQKILLDSDGFANCDILIKDTILHLSKNPELCIILIKKHQHEEASEFKGVIKTIVGNMFQNIVDDQIFRKDVFTILKEVVKIFVESKSHYFQYQFQQTNLVSQILKQFIQKPDFQDYAKRMSKGSLLQLAKLDKIIDFSQEQPYSCIKKIESKKFDSPTKNRSVSSVKSSFSIEANQSKRVAYSEALMKKDEKIRQTPNIRSKNKNCASLQLLRFLGVSDEINFPSFFSPKNEQEGKQEEQINKQWAVLLNKKESSKNIVQIPDIQLVKNLVFIFFSDLFKNLYSLPTAMRAVSKIMYERLQKKYDSKKACLSVISNFIIDFWICSTFKFDESLIQTGKIGDYTSKNAELIRNIIRGIVKNDYQKINPAFHGHFSNMMSNLRLSIFNYICELINIQVPQTISLEREDKIISYCVCLSISDVKCFIHMLENCFEQIQHLNEKIVKKVKKIIQISKCEDFDIYGQRKDKSTGKVYSNTHAYVQYTELSLPKQLSFDYIKFYNDSFKNCKIKNLLKQVLLNMSDIQFYDIPFHCQTLRQFFEEILATDQERFELHSLDRVPVNLKIQYLLTLTNSQFNFEKLVFQMKEQTQNRLLNLNKVSQKTKQCYLKALSNILGENQKISFSEINYREEIRKKKLEEFISKVNINVCLTSPKTRQKQIILRTNILKDVSEQQKQKIWLENQGKCIHTALNLQFIKSFTGQADKVKTKYESHITNIMKFPDILCALPEVKEGILNRDDTIGIKEVFSDFISYCIQLIKKKQTDYLMLIENENWLEESLEQKLSKKIYDKIYPKFPMYEDLGLYLRLKTLDWISYEHLKIEPSMRIDGMWDLAAKTIKNIEKMKTAGQKLNCIVQASKLILNSYSLICSSDKPVTADDIYSIFIYVLLKAAPRRLVSNIAFIDLFGNKSKLMSRDGYFFTQLKSAVEYCNTLTYETLDSSVDMVEFNRIIYEKQIEYGIYFLLGRKKDSPRTTFRKIQYLREHYFQKMNEKSEKLSND